MHSLFLRIFVLFWVAMALIVGGSIAITFTIAAREYEAPELQRRPSVAIQASEVLARGGIGALKSWLQANKNSIARPRSVHHRSRRARHPRPAPVGERRAAPGILQSRRIRQSRRSGLRPDRGAGQRGPANGPASGPRPRRPAISAPAAPRRKLSAPTARSTRCSRCRAVPAFSAR